MTGPINPANADTRRQLGDALAALQVALGEFERQVDWVIDHIVGDPHFAYIAADTSRELSARLAEVHARFDALYAVLGVQEHADVRAAQASLDTLRKTLQERIHFERDVMRALGSGSRQQIVELATRWWNGEERAIAVKKAVVDLRQKLDGVPDAKKSN